MNIEVTQVWLALGIKYDSLPRSAKPEIIDDLMDIHLVAEVCHHNEILILLDIEDDWAIAEEIATAKDRIEAVFKKYSTKI